MGHRLNGVRSRHPSQGAQDRITNIANLVVRGWEGFFVLTVSTSRSG
ncbi:MAG: hypothetical protein HIU91_07050 [Acidobacteria bacterium]|nr:hypothetical protein [Acidobacteriota bacterium]